MAQLGDFLTRFRPAGAPGAGSRAGVPADRAAERAAELEPVLALLAGAQTDAADRVAAARREAARIRAESREDAERIAAETRIRAQTARAEAAAEVLAAARARAAAIERAADAAAVARPAPPPDRVGPLVDEAVRLVRAVAAAGAAIESDLPGAAAAANPGRARAGGQR